MIKWYNEERSIAERSITNSKMSILIKNVLKMSILINLTI